MKTLRRVALALFALATVSAPRTAAAQFLSGHGAVAFLNDVRPSALLGVDLEFALHHCPLPDGTGPVVCEASSWWVSISPYLGATFSHAVQGSTPTGTASLGVGLVHRVCNTQALAVLGVASASPDGIGVAVRYEPLTLVGIEYGVLRLRSSTNAVYVRIDVAMHLLGDVTRGWTKHPAD